MINCKRLFAILLFWFIAFVLVIITIVSVFAFANVNDTLRVNFSSLPVSGSFNLSISAVSNTSVYLDQFIFNDHVNLSFPSVFFFNDTDSAIIPIFYSVDYLVSENVSLVVGLFGNSTFTSNYFHYKLFFNIVDDFMVVNESSVSDVRVLNGDYFINTSSNLLPLNGSLSYSVSGVPGKRADVSCSGWLSCPVSILFNSEGVSSFDVVYLVPLDVIVGSYVDQINFSVGNSSRQSFVRYIISDPDVSVKSFVWSDDCFSLDADGRSVVSYNCMIEYQDYQLNTWSKILRLSRDECTCENNTVVETEYVVVGDVDQDVYDELVICRDERNNYLNKYNDCNVLKVSGDNMVIKLKNQLLRNDSVLMASTIAKSIIMNSMAEEKVRSNNIRWIIVLSSFIVIGLLIVGIVYWFVNVFKKNNWS